MESPVWSQVWVKENNLKTPLLDTSKDTVYCIPYLTTLTKCRCSGPVPVLEGNKFFEELYTRLQVTTKAVKNWTFSNWAEGTNQGVFKIPFRFCSRSHHSRRRDVDLGHDDGLWRRQEAGQGAAGRAQRRAGDRRDSCGQVLAGDADRGSVAVMDLRPRPMFELDCDEDLTIKSTMASLLPSFGMLKGPDVERRTS